MAKIAKNRDVESICRHTMLFKNLGNLMPCWTGFTSQLAASYVLYATRAPPKAQHPLGSA